jgi:hypothetical protein
VSAAVEMHITEAEGALEIALVGIINESFVPGDAHERARARPVRLLLEGVRRINSAGVREWVRFLAGLVAAADSVELLRCSPALVQQMAMIPSARAGARITSFLAPFSCTACGAERLVALAPGDDVNQAQLCTCGGSLELDDTAEPYQLLARTSA